MRKPRRKLKTAKSAKRRRPRGGKSRKRFISPAEARRRAERHVLKRMFRGATVRDGNTARWRVYDPTGKLAGKDVWLVYPNPEQPLTELRSSQLIAVCKRTGRVLYDGSAGDEG
jgi:hypothetical protein